jgi:Lysine methyltransferase
MIEFHPRYVYRLIVRDPNREAAYAMAFYVQDPPSVDFDPSFDLSLQRPSTVLELGSGSGMVGSMIARKLPEGQDLLIVTDLPEVCPLLKANLRGPGANAADRVLVRQLTWGNSEHAANIASEFFTGISGHPRFLTHVICSDLVSLHSWTVRHMN